MNRFCGALLTILLTITLTPQVAVSADEEIDEDAQRCISTRLIRRTVIVNDRTILFYSTGRKAYLNTLPRTCHGLKREDRFSYRSSVGQLCDLDSINVLYGSASGLQEGISCGLGLFIPMSYEDADALRDPSPREPQPAEVPLPEPDEIGAEPEDPEPEN
jgi:hypothetical protein